MVSRDSRCLSAPPQQSTWNCKQNLLHVSCFPHLCNSEVGMHLSTPQTKLKFFQYCKLCTHNAALYRPLQRQTSQQDLAHRLTAVADLWSKQSWRGWCALLLRPGKVPCQVDLPGKKFQKHTAAPSVLRKQRDPAGRQFGEGRPRSTMARRFPKKGRFAAFYAQHFKPPLPPSQSGGGRRRNGVIGACVVHNRAQAGGNCANLVVFTCFVS